MFKELIDVAFFSAMNYLSFYAPRDSLREEIDVRRDGRVTFNIYIYIFNAALL